MSGDDYWMAQALACAQQAELADEVPVGAVLVHQDQLIAQGFNQSISRCDPCAHAEILTLQAGAKALANYRLLNATLYVTLEPCAMCVGAMVHARIERLVYGATDPKAGAVMGAIQLLNAPHFNHKIAVSSGVLAEQASEQLKAFFKKRRRS